MRELNGRSGPFREGLGSHPEGGMIELKPEGRAGNKEVRGPWEPREDLPGTGKGPGYREHGISRCPRPVNESAGSEREKRPRWAGGLERC